MTQLKKKLNLKDLFYIFIILVFTVTVAVIDSGYTEEHNESSISMEIGWTDEDGALINLSKLPAGNSVISTELPDQEINDKRLCLKSIDTFFDVSADGKEIYSYRPKISKLLGRSYGMYVHDIYIPAGAKELTLRAEPVFKGKSPLLKDVVIEDAGEYMTDLLKNNILAFIRSSITIIFGLILLILGIPNGILSRSSGLDLISFGTLCVLLGFIGLNDTYMPQIITQMPAAVRVITYICLIFIPYPALSFFSSASGIRDSKIIRGSLIVCMVNFIATVALTYTGISDYYHMVNVSHIVITAGFFAAAFMVGSAIAKHTIRPNLVRSLSLGLSACIAGAAIDVIRYHRGNINGFSNYSRTGVLIFLFIMGIYMFRDQVRALNQKHKDNITFINEITAAFAKIIDMKDRYTNGHSSRVAKYTAMLARELGYDEDTVQKYYRIALLHDIGKIGIPQSVLNKPGKLTEEEFEIIKSHTTKGYEVLKDISIMPELSVGAGAHHERPDGKGYPKGLKGDEIPKVAQIIAVADCFDAMYSNRPYRERMNFDIAVSIIKEVSGTQLSGEVVDAFLRLVDNGKFRAPDDKGGGSTENIDNIHKKFGMAAEKKS